MTLSQFFQNCGILPFVRKQQWCCLLGLLFINRVMMGAVAALTEISPGLTLQDKNFSIQEPYTNWLSYLLLVVQMRRAPWEHHRLLEISEHSKNPGGTQSGSTWAVTRNLVIIYAAKVWQCPVLCLTVPRHNWPSSRRRAGVTGLWNTNVIISKDPLYSLPPSRVILVGVNSGYVVYCCWHN